MYISKELRKKNIAEYLLYMWQVEDLLRANKLSIDNIKTNMVAPYNLPEDKEKELLEWYSNLIAMMHTEGVTESGHLQINKNILITLSELHKRLIYSSKVPFYSAAYY